MEIEIIKKIIESQRIELEEKFKKENIIKREKIDQAKKFIKHPNILVVMGIRRCGKSVFSVMLANSMSKKLGHINFDDERLLGLKANDLENVLQAFYELYGDVDIIILDEPQNVIGWEMFANRLRRTKRVIITGSNSNLLGGELATALTGRHLDIFMFPFSFKEFLNFKPNIYLTEDIAKTKKELKKYLNGSGFPEYPRFGSEMVLSLYEDIVHKDCIRRYAIRNEKSFREMSKYLISNFSSEFTYSKLSRITGIKDVHTVKNYVDYLKQTFLIYVLERFSFKLKQQIIAPKKIYVTDHGFANFLSFKMTKKIGALFENVVCMELFNKYSNQSNINIFYYKSVDGKEVDFVVKDGRRVTKLIQVCYDIDDVDTKEREIISLLKASKELKCNNLMIITDDYEAEEKHKGRRIKFMPLWKWLLS